MSLPSLNGVARLIEDPELRFGANGKAIAKVRLAFNSRKKDQASGEWVDSDSFFIDGKAFDQAAENIAGSLTRGMEVVVSGRLRTEKWESKEGEKRSAPALMIDSIGPSLRFATAAVTKTTGGGQGGYGQQNQGQGQQPARQAQGQRSAGDPWSQSQGGQQGGGWGNGSAPADEPPF